MQSLIRIESGGDIPDGIEEPTKRSHNIKLILHDNDTGQTKIQVSKIDARWEASQAGILWDSQVIVRYVSKKLRSIKRTDIKTLVINEDFSDYDLEYDWILNYSKETNTYTLIGETPQRPDHYITINSKCEEVQEMAFQLLQDGESLLLIFNHLIKEQTNG